MSEVFGAAKLLAVHLTQNLTISQHIDALVTVCNQRLYLLAQLKRHGLDLNALDSVFNAIIANKILYALPVYYGYLTQGHKEMLQRIFKRANRRGFTVREYELNVSWECSVRFIS